MRGLRRAIAVWMVAGVAVAAAGAGTLTTVSAGALGARSDAGQPEGVHRVVRLENDRVLVVENRYDPGAESALHTHASPRVVYVLDGGAVRLVAEDGSTTDVRLEPGMTIWRPAETHVVRNTGRTTVRLLETEVRDPS